MRAQLRSVGGALGLILISISLCLTGCMKVGSSLPSPILEGNGSGYERTPPTQPPAPTAPLGAPNSGASLPTPVLECQTPSGSQQAIQIGVAGDETAQVTWQAEDGSSSSFTEPVSVSSSATELTVTGPGLSLSVPAGTGTHSGQLDVTLGGVTYDGAVTCDLKTKP